jgi:ParB/RepB/Spo0J family partition protein
MGVREIEKILIQHIDVSDRLRSLNEDGVKSLMASFQKIGLRTPITVRVDPAYEYQSPVLVSGLHRLEAARRLGWDEIECFVTEDADENRARMWEIAENLHRCELTTLERSEQIAEWVRLSGLFHVKHSLHPKDEGKRAAARDLGLAPATVHRALKIDSLSDEAKEAARETGVESSTRKLMEVASLPSDQQASAVREIARQPAMRPFKVAADPLEDVGALERQVARLMDAWNAAGPDARQEFLSRIDQPIMDRRFA